MTFFRRALMTLALTGAGVAVSAGIASAAPVPDPPAPYYGPHYLYDPAPVTAGDGLPELLAAALAALGAVALL